MGDTYLQEFGRETLRKTPLGISGGIRQDNIKMDLKVTEYVYVDWIIWLRIETSVGKFQVSSKCILIGVRHIVCLFVCQSVS
jgi:hypothetical protein